MFLWDRLQTHVSSNSITVVGKFIHNLISSWLISSTYLVRFWNLEIFEYLDIWITGILKYSDIGIMRNGNIQCPVTIFCSNFILQQSHLKQMCSFKFWMPFTKYLDYEQIFDLSESKYSFPGMTNRPLIQDRSYYLFF